MKFSKVELKNNLRVLVVPLPNLESATLTIWVKTGSRLEEDRVAGISHFLEHMVFKGSKKRPTAKEIAEAVDAIGGEFNAATSKDWTNFYIKARAANLETAFDVLSDMVLAPILAEEEIAREKGVIIEEIRMYEDTPMLRINDVYEQLTFSGNPLGRDIIGSEKTVSAVKRDDFVRYRNTHYYPENMLVTVAGGVNQRNVQKLAESYLASIKPKSKSAEKMQEFAVKQTKPQVKLHPKKKEQAHFILGFTGHGRGYKGKYAEAVLAAILGGGMSSRLFSEVRERRGLAYSVRTSVERYAETGYVGTYAGVDPKRVDEAIKVTLDEHYKLASQKSGVSLRELSKAKEYLKGHLALSLEDTRDVNNFFAEQELFLKKVKTPEQVVREIDKVEIDAVLSEAKNLFLPQKLNLAIIGPYDSQERFAKLLR
ncbi:MAG: M16 family metallopeptidase [Patescibacteria group bacterium]